MDRLLVITLLCLCNEIEKFLMDIEFVQSGMWRGIAYLPCQFYRADFTGGICYDGEFETLSRQKTLESQTKNNNK